MSEEKTSTKKQLQLPSNFQQILIEVVSPDQSIDYITIGDRLFNICVLPIAQEKKFLRLAKHYESDMDQLIALSTGELCHFYYQDLSLDWASKNASKEELEQFYVKHLEKLTYNDEVIGVVAQVMEQISWARPDGKRQEEFERYLPANIFSPIMLYLNVLEHVDVKTIFTTMTRGLLEIVKLGNMISNDRMRPDDSKSDLVNRKMTQAGTLDEYMSGLSEQGFSLKNLM